MVEEKYMKEAVKEAKKAFAAGEVPIGAVLVCGDKIIARGYNKKETSKKATAHAEIIAVEKACKKKGDWRLNDCTLYVTAEPCLMCCGAILQARIGRLVFGISNDKFGCVESIDRVLENAKHNHHIKIEKGLCAGEAASLLQQFFQKNRVK